MYDSHLSRHAPNAPFFSRPHHGTDVSRRPCCAVALRRTALSEHGMSSVNQTRPQCVNQTQKTNSKPSAARHGRGVGTACFVWIGLYGTMRVTASKATQSVLQLSTRCRWGVNLSSRALYSRHLLNGRMGGPWSQSWTFWRREKSLAPAGNSDRKTPGDADLTFCTKMLYVFELSRPYYMYGPSHLPFSLNMSGGDSTFNFLIMQCPSPLLLVPLCKHIQGVTGGTDQTSGECSLGQTIPI